RVSSRNLVFTLNSLTDRPWTALGKGKEITEIGLAQQLRPYGIRPKAMRLGTVVVKGYREEDFSEVFHRYVSRAEFDAFVAQVCPTEPPPASAPATSGEPK